MSPRVIVLALTGVLLVAGPGTAGTIAGKVEASKAKYLPGTVVYVRGVPGEFAPPEEPAVMDQKDLVFIPHVLPVVAGTTVRFHNSDEVEHNVFTPDVCAGEFNLGSWGKNGAKERTFESPGCSAVMLCNVHPEMEAYVVVLDNPYFCVVDDEGAFRIEEVPPGTHEVRVWNKRLKADPQEVTVEEEGVIELELALKR